MVSSITIDLQARVVGGNRCSGGRRIRLVFNDHRLPGIRTGSKVKMFGSQGQVNS